MEEQTQGRAAVAGILRNNMGPLIPVKPRSHDDSKAFHGTDMRPCQIILGKDEHGKDKQAFPSKLSYKPGPESWNLAKYEFGLHVNPCLELLLYCGERGSKDYDFKRVQWNPVGGQMTDITEEFVGIQVNEDGTFRIELDESGSIPIGGAHVRYSFRTEGCTFAPNLGSEVADMFRNVESSV